MHDGGSLPATLRPMTQIDARWHTFRFWNRGKRLGSGTRWESAQCSRSLPLWWVLALLLHWLELEMLSLAVVLLAVAWVVVIELA